MSDFREVALDFLTNLFSFDQAHPLLFTQFYFWAFFAFVMAFLCLFKNKTLMRNAFLFFASLFFYYKTSGLFIILFGFVIVYNYLTGRLLPHCRRRFWKGLVLFLGIAVDLSLLFYYKYAYFLTDVVNNLFGTGFEVKDYFAVAGNLIAGHNAFSVDSIFLPVGISFFTFQAISYIVDVYRGRYALLPVRSFFDFGFYLSFFPQLVAGPIVRADEFIPQLRKPFFLTRRQFGIAIFWILNGLAKKLIMSDFIAISLCDRVFENPTLYTGFENLLAMFCYSLQIYADFSGYTDIAIGTAMLMGFYLPKNFNSPYKATNMSVFWKRWHISLSRWLKDYLYIPLGGNRKGTVWSYLILVCTGFLASALRPLARGKLEFHDLGWPERTGDDNLPLLEQVQRLCPCRADGGSLRNPVLPGDQLSFSGFQPVPGVDPGHFHRVPGPHALPFLRIQGRIQVAGKRLGCFQHVRVLYIHDDVLPERVQHRSGRGQCEGMGERPEHHRPDRRTVGPEPYPEDSRSAQGRHHPLHRRNAHPLASGPLQAALPHLVCEYAASSDGPGLRTGGIHHLPVPDRRPPKFHIFPILTIV